MVTTDSFEGLLISIIILNVQFSEKKWGMQIVRKYDHTQENKHWTVTVSEEALTLDLLDKDFKSSILVFKELNVTKSKDVQENMICMLH